MRNEKKPTSYSEKEFKSILNKRNFVDSWFWDRYTINTYNGCQIGCIYCNSRKAKYHLPIDFERDIIVKSNIKSILRSELKKIPSHKKDVVVLSGSTDPYQAAERKYLNTKQALELLLEYEFPVHIITKSRLVLRDLDILEQIAERTWCTISISISTISNENAKFLEPGAPFPSQRMEIVKEITNRTDKIQTGILGMPIIPFISDSEGEIGSFIHRVSDSGANYFCFAAGLTMDSTQALWYLSKINQERGDLIPLYENLFQFKYNEETYRGNYTPPHDYQHKLNKFIYTKCQELNLPIRIKRYIPNDQRKLNYQIAETLHKKSYQFQLTGNAQWKSYSKFGGYLDNLDTPIDLIFSKNKEIYKKEFPSELLDIVEKRIMGSDPTPNLHSWFG